MKRRAVERVERRRPMVEMNLVGEPKPRLSLPRKGCLSFLTPVLLGLAALLIEEAGLR